MKKSRSIRQQLTTITKFEQFPPEIFFEIFEYLTGNHIFKSFYNLNKHFKQLVYNTPNVHLDLSRTKTKLFHTFLRVFTSKNIVSIVLSYENINVLETLFNSTHGTRFKSLAILVFPLHAFENKMPEILNICKQQLISLKISFADMHYSDTGFRSAQSFGYILKELPLLKHLILESSHGIDAITYMPSSIINNTIVSLTISVRVPSRLIPLLYRFEKLKTLTIHYSSVRMKMAMPSDAIMSYRSQLREKTSIDYLITIRHIKVYDDEMVLERMEQLLQIIISPTLLTLSLFTSKRPFQIHIMRWRGALSLNGIQWNDFLKRFLPSTIKQFHIEYKDVDPTAFMGNLVRPRKEFIKYSGFDLSWKVSCYYKLNEKCLLFDVFPI